MENNERAVYNLLVLDPENDVRLSFPVGFEGMLFVRASGKRWAVTVDKENANIVEIPDERRGVS